MFLVSMRNMKYIPANETVKKVLELLIKSIYELSDSNLSQEEKHYILDPDTSITYTNDQIIRDTNIKNSKKVILI